jgi:hypothetical protein
MTLKQIKNLDRIVFLKKFVAELLINAIKEQATEQEIKIEKLKQKFIQPAPLPDQAFKEVIKTPIFESSEELEKRAQTEKLKIEQMQKIQEERKIQKFEELKQAPIKPSFADRLRRPIFHRVKQKPIPINQRQRVMTSQKPQIQQNPSSMQRSMQKPAQIIKTKTVSRPPVEDIRKIKPEIEQRPSGFSLGKIEKILRDKSIQSIECPGPGKRILVKKLNKINSTPLVLGQPEISKVIQSFASQAKIPVVGGILKAAVGDMIISAVISEYVGSRFIINKITPYSILQR